MGLDINQALTLAKKILVDHGFHAPMLLFLDRDGLRHATQIHGEHDGPPGVLVGTRKKLKQFGATEYILICQSKSIDALMAYHVFKEPGPSQVKVTIVNFSKFNGSHISFKDDIVSEGRPKEFGPMAKLFGSNIHVPKPSVTQRTF